MELKVLDLVVKNTEQIVKRMTFLVLDFRDRRQKRGFEQASFSSKREGSKLVSFPEA